MKEDTSEWILMGRIVGLFGVRGWVKVFSYTDPRHAILDYPVWRMGPNRQAATVLDGKRQGKGIIALLDETESRDDAARWVGQDIAIARDELPEPDEGQYYWSDLVDLTVRRANGESIGRVASLLETGAHDVLVVKGDIERLIPFKMNDTILAVDLDGGEITVDWDWD